MASNEYSQNEPIGGHESAIGGFNDRRARLSAKPAARTEIYGPKQFDNILRPLWETGGLLWPYTPIINDNASVMYDSYDPIHSNQPYMAFKSVAPKEIMCSGQFTAMNQDEALYCIAAIHFLRSITKMYFGVGGLNTGAINKRGTPPPVLLFNAHGTAMFHNVPVIVTSYSIELPQDVDYVETYLDGRSTNLAMAYNEVIDIRPEEKQTWTGIKVDGASAWVPTKFTITANMTVQNSPNRMRRNFNLNDFRTGSLIKKGGWV